MPGIGRLGDKAQAPLDAHGCPACPHPVVGPAVVGSPTVNVNKLPALRCTDTGIHMACCGLNTWQVFKGAPTVFIDGKRAHRQGDDTKHCGGMGKLIEGSPNVIVGGAPTACSPQPPAPPVVPPVAPPQPPPSPPPSQPPPAQPPPSQPPPSQPPPAQPPPAQPPPSQPPPSQPPPSQPPVTPVDPVDPVDPDKLPGTLTVRVIDQAGAPVANATVTASGPSALPPQTTTASGEIAFGAAEPGAYRLAVTALGYTAGSGTASVVAGQPTSATLRVTLTWTAAWGEGPAQLGKAIALELVAADLPPSTPVRFAVTQLGFGPIGEVTASAGSGGAVASWSDWYDFDRVTSRVQLAAGQPFAVVRFSFVATANGVAVPSAAPLAYADTLNAQLIGDDGQPMADTDYQLVSPWGTRAGTARADGTLDEPGLPPGGVTVLVNSRGMTH